MHGGWGEVIFKLNNGVEHVGVESNVRNALVLPVNLVVIVLERFMCNGQSIWIYYSPQNSRVRSGWSGKKLLQVTTWTDLKTYIVECENSISCGCVSTDGVVNFEIKVSDWDPKTGTIGSGVPVCNWSLIEHIFWPILETEASMTNCGRFIIFMQSE